MAAISATLLQLCNTGDHIVASSAVYGQSINTLLEFCMLKNCALNVTDVSDPSTSNAGGTFAFLKSFLPARCGISTTFVDISDLSAVKTAITERTKVRSQRPHEERQSTGRHCHAHGLILSCACRWSTRSPSPTQLLWWQIFLLWQTLLMHRCGGLTCSRHCLSA